METKVENQQNHIEYVSTYDMGFEDVEKWEKDENGCVIYGDVEGIMELSASQYYSTDGKGNKIAGTEKPMIYIGMLEENGNSEAYVCISDKERIEKLRDYLNKYLEEHYQ